MAYKTLENYFSHIGDYDLLTAQQERDLAEKMSKGDSRARSLMISIFLPPRSL